MHTSMNIDITSGKTETKSVAPVLAREAGESLSLLHIWNMIIVVPVPPASVEIGSHTHGCCPAPTRPSSSS